MWSLCGSIYLYRREIGALQAENYSLERQLFSYQKSIAYAHAHQHPQPHGTPRGGSHSSHHSAENSYDGSSNEHRHPFLDRGVSTDTEYA